MNIFYCQYPPCTYDEHYTYHVKAPILIHVCMPAHQNNLRYEMDTHEEAYLKWLFIKRTTNWTALDVYEYRYSYNKQDTGELVHRYKSVKYLTEGDSHLKQYLVNTNFVRHTLTNEVSDEV